MLARLVLLNIRKPEILAAGGRWISVLSALEVLRKITHRLNSRNMAGTDWRKASCPFVLKCALRRLFSLEMAIRCPTSIESAL
jgi:hypothetical protein